MNEFYALTLNTTGKGSSSTKTYHRSMDALEKKYSVKIFPRIFETGKVMKKLHCHALVTRSVSYPPLSTMVAEKNKNIKLESVHDMQGWLNYMNKENPPIMKKLF